MISDVLKDAVGQIDKYAADPACRAMYAEHAGEIRLVRTVMYALQLGVADHDGEKRSRGQGRLMEVLWEVSTAYDLAEVVEASNAVFSDPDEDDDPNA
jgi:hypothetical protein